MAETERLTVEQELFATVQGKYYDLVGCARVGTDVSELPSEVFAENGNGTLNFRIQREDDEWRVHFRPTNQASTEFPVVEGVTISSAEHQFLVGPDDSRIVIGSQSTEISTYSARFLMRHMWDISTPFSDIRTHEFMYDGPTLKERVFDIFARADVFNEAARSAHDVLGEYPATFVDYEMLEEDDPRVQLFPDRRVATIRAADIHSGTEATLCFEVDEVGLVKFDVPVLCKVVCESVKKWFTVIGEEWKLRALDVLIGPETDNAEALLPDDSIEYLDQISVEELEEIFMCVHPIPD